MLYLTVLSDDEPKREPDMPEQVALPPPKRDTARSTLAFLAGRGADLSLMHRTAEDVADDLGGQRCDATVERLNRRAPANRMPGLIAGVADPPLRAAFTEERTALGVALTRCVRDDPRVNAAADRLEAAGELVALRIRQLERAAR